MQLLVHCKLKSDSIGLSEGLAFSRVKQELRMGGMEGGVLDAVADVTQRSRKSEDVLRPCYGSIKHEASKAHWNLEVMRFKNVPFLFDGLSHDKLKLLIPM